MIAVTTRPEQRRNRSPRLAQQLQLAENSPSAKRVLIAEHRDEVFARLAHDVGATGRVVFRATRADEVPNVYAFAEASLAICNIDLPGASGWLTATKLQMCWADARVWLYAPHKSALDAAWAKLSGVERVLYYQGDLFRLADQLKENIQGSVCRVGVRRWHKAARQGRWKTTL